MTSVLSCSDVLEVLRRHALLEPAQLEALGRVTPAPATLVALGKVILDRGWLTPFQVNRILGGKTQELFIGQYLLQAKIGEGGMGQVFRALDRTMNRTVALKLIRPDVLNSDQAIERFLKEIRAAASLDHPNIVRAYHASRLDSGYFLVMEYVEGTDLHQRIGQGHPLPIPVVCDWVRQAALALQHVSERGMVHRDVKPMNLLLSMQGVVKLLDLGLARQRQLAAPIDAPQATRQGSMMGTPDYVAPEQIADASSVDIRADIYSLGCTAYHLLTGSPPFKGDDLRHKLRCHIVEEPELVERLRPDIPPEFAALVRRMMRKEPAERPQKPHEVADALAKFAVASPAPELGTASWPNPQGDTIPPSISPSLTEEVKPGTIQRRKRWGIAAGVAVLAVAVVLFLLWNPFAGSNEKADRREEQARKGDPSDDPRKPEAPDKPPPKDAAEKPPPRDPPDNLPDKVPLAIVPPREPPPWKGRLPWQPAELAQVLGDERGRHWGAVNLVVWSGDGRRLASSGIEGVRVWDAATLREEAYLKDTYQASALALSPDGKRLLLMTWRNDVQVWDLAGAVPRQEGTLKAPETVQGNTLLALTFSPDGKSVLGLTHLSGVLQWNAKRLDREAEELIEPGAAISLPQTLNHQGKWLARAAYDQTRCTLFVRNLGAPADKERTVGEFLGVCRSLALSPDGRLLAAISGTDPKESWGSSVLRVWSLDGETPTERGRFEQLKAGMGLLTFSQDGKRLAAASKSEILVWQMGAEGPGKPAILKGHMGFPQSLAFSPTGPVLASAGDGGVRIWDLSRAPADGVETAGFKVHHLAFSADGKKLATALRTLATRTSIDDDSLIRVQSLDRPAEAKEAVFQGFLHSVVLSPDGKTLVACGTASQKRLSKKRLWGVMEVRNAQTLELIHEKGFAEDAFRAQFHEDGKLCTLVAQSPVVFHQFETGGWKERGDGRMKTSFGAVSPDGRLGVTRQMGNEVGVGSTDEAVIWDLQRLDGDAPMEKKRFTLGVFPGTTEVMQAFSPDGTRVAFVTATSQIELWDALKGQQLGRNQGQYAKLSCLVFSPDGSLIATIEDEKRVAVWRTDGKVLKAYREPWTFPGPIHSIAFDPSGHFLATANANGSVYLLRVRAAE